MFILASTVVFWNFVQCPHVLCKFLTSYPDGVALLSSTDLATFRRIVIYALDLEA